MNPHDTCVTDTGTVLPTNTSEMEILVFTASLLPAPQQNMPTQSWGLESQDEESPA